MVAHINSGAIALMTGIGHRTGLFDAMAELPPATSDEIALAVGLEERYVREWLAAMVLAEVVEHDPTTGTYLLPPSRAAVLTSPSRADNVAALAQSIGPP